MASKKIFIASAEESKDTARVISQELANNGYDPKRWWREFPGGSITIERLAEIAQGEADGAVFLFSGVDETWYRSNMRKTPRDNVILEYGLFLSEIGLDKSLILKDKDTKLPSDVNYVTYNKLSRDKASVAENTVSHFDAVFNEASLPLRAQSLHIIADPSVVADQLAETLPSDWLSRSLYVGLGGAKAWIEASGDPKYQEQTEDYKIRTEVINAIKDIDVRTFASLGPGDGVLDKDIATSLKQSEPWLQYIPIDISNGLLQKSYERLATNVRIPVGILSDFEDRLNFINHYVNKYGSKPILYSMIGNTFGNLDKFESSFLQSMQGILGRKDFFLMVVTILKDDNGEDFSEPDIGTGIKRWLSHGISKRIGKEVSHVEENIDSILDIESSRRHSDVPNTITFINKETIKGSTISYVRRYDFESLKSWIEDKFGLQIIYSKRINLVAPFDNGIMMIKKCIS